MAVWSKRQEMARSMSRIVERKKSKEIEAQAREGIVHPGADPRQVGSNHAEPCRASAPFLQAKKPPLLRDSLPRTGRRYAPGAGIYGQRQPARALSVSHWNLEAVGEETCFAQGDRNVISIVVLVLITGMTSLSAGPLVVAGGYNRQL
eukprot:756749-Hanusia_phi.AAC.17